MEYCLILSKIADRYLSWLELDFCAGFDLVKNKRIGSAHKFLYVICQNISVNDLTRNHFELPILMSIFAYIKVGNEEFTVWHLQFLKINISAHVIWNRAEISVFRFYFAVGVWFSFLVSFRRSCRFMDFLDCLKFFPRSL